MNRRAFLKACGGGAVALIGLSVFAGKAEAPKLSEFYSVPHPWTKMVPVYQVKRRCVCVHAEYVEYC